MYKDDKILFLIFFLIYFIMYCTSITFFRFIYRDNVFHFFSF